MRRNHARRWLIAVGAALFFGVVGAGHATALTLDEALAHAYASNPQLGAVRAEQRKTSELTPQALAVVRPDVSGQLGAGFSQKGPVPQAQVQARVPLLTLGRGAAATARARALIDAESSRVDSTEQQVLLRAATAYMDVLRAQEALKVSARHEATLRAELASAQRRLKAGATLQSDVMQTDAQLSTATAGHNQAEGELEIAKEIFREIVGEEPAHLVQPSPPQGLPVSLEDAVQMAQAGPDVRAAQANVSAARSGVDGALAALRPSLDLEAVAGLQQSAVLGVVTIPFYDGGLSQSRARAARADREQSRLTADGALRNARQNAVTSWQALRTARADVTAYTSQLGAASATRDGVRRELAQGARSQLELLIAEEQVLAAGLNLAGARRDVVVASYQLLAAVGRLSAGDLGLTPVPGASATAPAQRRGFWDQSVINRAYGLSGAP